MFRFWFYRSLHIFRTLLKHVTLLQSLRPLFVCNALADLFSTYESSDDQVRLPKLSGNLTSLCMIRLLGRFSPLCSAPSFSPLCSPTVYSSAPSFTPWRLARWPPLHLTKSFASPAKTSHVPFPTHCINILCIKTCIPLLIFETMSIISSSSFLTTIQGNPSHRFDHSLGLTIH